ncbi:MAG TPA: peptidase M48 [Gammaproteobacteria bacterium]|nr:peptidase M48 [Gammaproteobacteria bacterium]
MLATMAAFLALLGYLLWGGDGLWILMLSGMLMAVGAPAVTPRLTMRLYHARPLSAAEAPRLRALVRDLAYRAGLPEAPQLYYVPSAMVNAFTVGGANDAAIAVTDGLLHKLNVRELRGVLAHEISHIRNKDTWVMGLADLFHRLTSALSLFGQFLLLLNLPLILFSGVTINGWAVALLIFAPTLSVLAQLGLSRSREYDADLGAARLTGDPEGLAQALLKMERVQGGWIERLFLPGRRLPEPSWLRTHPPTEERVQRLLALQQEGQGQELSGHSGEPWIETRPVRRHPRWRPGSGVWY